MNTSIEWTDRTWNPTRGCSLVSPGCTNCYAMRQAHRFSGKGQPYHGLTKQTTAGPQWTGHVVLSEPTLRKPLSWRRPSRVFVDSMSDLFHESLPDEYIDTVFAVMAIRPQHTFQVLTKRAERMRQYISSRQRDAVKPDQAIISTERVDSGLHYSVPWPLPNVWLGVSVEDQQRADERIPLLLETPAEVRFISAEPLLGPIDLTRYLSGESRLDWIIVGGESSSRRPRTQQGVSE